MGHLVQALKLGADEGGGVPPKLAPPTDHPLGPRCRAARWGWLSGVGWGVGWSVGQGEGRGVGQGVGCGVWQGVGRGAGWGVGRGIWQGGGRGEGEWDGREGWDAWLLGDLRGAGGCGHLFGF